MVWGGVFDRAEGMEGGGGRRKAEGGRTIGIKLSQIDPRYFFKRTIKYLAP